MQIVAMAVQAVQPVLKHASTRYDWYARGKLPYCVLQAFLQSPFYQSLARVRRLGTWVITHLDTYIHRYPR